MSVLGTGPACGAEQLFPGPFRRPSYSHPWFPPRLQDMMERCYLSQSHRRPSTSDRWYYIPDPSLPSQNMSGHGTLNPLCIGYAFRPDLSSRLTQGGRTLPWRPQSFGAGDSHPRSLLTPAFSLERGPPVLSVRLRPAFYAPLPRAYRVCTPATPVPRLAPVNFRRGDA